MKLGPKRLSCSVFVCRYSFSIGAEGGGVGGGRQKESGPIPKNGASHVLVNFSIRCMGKLAAVNLALPKCNCQTLGRSARQVVGAAIMSHCVMYICFLILQGNRHSIV